MSRSITYTALDGVPLVEPGDDLAVLIEEALERTGLVLEAGDILIVAQKIVSKAAGRYVDLRTIEPSARALELASVTRKDPRYVEVVLSESTEVVRTAATLIIVAHRLGFVMANAGIDESNIRQPEGAQRVLLLPDNPDAACEALKDALEKRFKAPIGVLISDSFGRPWRNGVVGVALGAAGVPALWDMVGKPDLFGRAMRTTEVAIADNLASGASVLMGEGDEGRPVVLVRGFRSASPHRPAAALVRDKARDLFR